MRIYIAGPIAGGNPRREDVVLAANYLTSRNHEILTPFVVDPSINEARFTEFAAKDRNNRVTEDDVIRLLTSDVLISFVNSSSYGMGFEEGFIAAGNLFGGTNVKLLKLMHTEDWEANKSKIAGNELFGELKVYYNSESLLASLESFLNRNKSVEGVFNSQKERR